MKKIVSIILLIMLCLTSLSVYAEEIQYLTVDGSISSDKECSILAPFGGIVKDINIAIGDCINTDDNLFVIETNKIYAPCNGKISMLDYNIGDNLDNINTKYGATLYIEPDNNLIINTSTKNAYNTIDNMLLNVGEIVYLRAYNTRNRTGLGVITAFDGENYTVEINENNLKFDERVYIYKDSDYSSSLCIGYGDTEANPNIAVLGTGILYKMHVDSNDTVKSGDLIMETIEGQYVNSIPLSNSINSSEEGVISSVLITAGSTVTQNQCIATYNPKSSYYINGDFSENDIQYMNIGKSVKIEIPSLNYTEMIEGTIDSISGISTSEDDIIYSVGVSFDVPPDARLGMTAYIYISK